MSVVCGVTTLHPPVENRDLGGAENVDVYVLSLESHCRYLSLSHATHSNVTNMFTHESDS